MAFANARLSPVLLTSQLCLRSSCEAICRLGPLLVGMPHGAQQSTVLTSAGSLSRLLTRSSGMEEEQKARDVTMHSVSRTMIHSPTQQPIVSAS
jgi:hypothetical protein